MLYYFIYSFVLALKSPGNILYLDIKKPSELNQMVIFFYFIALKIIKIGKNKINNNVVI